MKTRFRVEISANVSPYCIALFSFSLLDHEASLHDPAWIGNYLMWLAGKGYHSHSQGK